MVREGKKKYGGKRMEKEGVDSSSKSRCFSTSNPNQQLMSRFTAVGVGVLKERKRVCECVCLCLSEIEGGNGTKQTKPQKMWMCLQDKKSGLDCVSVSHFSLQKNRQSKRMFVHNSSSL